MIEAVFCVIYYIPEMRIYNGRVCRWVYDCMASPDISGLEKVKRIGGFLPKMVSYRTRTKNEPRGSLQRR